MASNTTRLNLYKANPVTDKDDTFNIDTILNDNWDKIDANVAKLADIPTIPSNLPANGGNSTTVNSHTAAATANTDEKIDLIGMTNEVNAKLLSHEAEKATQDVLGHVKKGTDINIDSNGVISVDSGITANKILKLPTGLASGDILYVNGSGQLVRLPKGTDTQALILSGGLPVWGSAGAKCVNGSYNGDGTNNRNISVGFRPKLLILILGQVGWAINNDYSNYAIVFTSSNITYDTKGQYGLAVYFSSDGFTVNNVYSNNTSGTNYQYIAMG
ncbi:hypothetical protein [Clostridium scatologenes]|uniref:Tail fiber repeat 2 protein n=1 Tax=Clostridium scatologenes TaxID=1548 RepID=A0A0E3GQH1_CLOSL|nr:hypothetical protein [Clostridium scatologenes]AKA68561.1 tail fiber repeat 2 protein [Clostridium scatologenes]